MRILSLGSNGQIGRLIYFEIARRFHEAEILACVRQKHFHFEGVNGNAQQHSIVFDPLHDDWKKIGRVDFVINCIGVINEKHTSFHEAHVLPVLKLLDHYTALGEPHVIQISALGAAHDAPTSFLRTKAFADNLLLQLPKACILRPSVVCTPGTAIVQKLRRLKRISKFTAGRVFLPASISQTCIQPVAGEDLAELVCTIIKKWPAEKIISVTGKIIFTMKELIECAGGKVAPVPAKIFAAARVCFSGLLNREEFRMLQRDNTASNETMEKILRRKAKSTSGFFAEELNPKRTPLALFTMA